MIENRELTMDDYLRMLRRRLKVILIPTLLAPLVGFAVSYAFTPKYTSQSLVLVEGQKVPEGYVAPVVSEDLSNRIATLEQRALSAERLRPIIENLKLASGDDINAKMDDIRLNVFMQPVEAITVAPVSGGNKKKGDLPGFNLNYSASNPNEAQKVCAALTDVIVQENLKDRAAAAQDTTNFMGRQVEDDKRKLDDMDSKLADFKRHYIGQLPGDAENNLKILMGYNSQLEASTQILNRAQQDKAYAESMLAEQLAAWKLSSGSTDPKTVQKQLNDLQTQLIALKARYTDDYPEVVKTKKDIAALQQKMSEINAATANPGTTPDTAVTAGEPPEIQQLRLQVHQSKEVIAQATRAQQGLQTQIKLYQGRVSLSPEVEEQYKQLTRDYETLQKVYDDDLAKKRQSEKQTSMELEQQGEQMRVLRPADLPDSPSFPNRWMFAGGGLAGGLALGFGLALWLELRDTSVRTEEDVIALLELPVLSQLPWVGTKVIVKNGTGKTKVGVDGSGGGEKERVEV
jgi:polysaccharide chain length determinant protein (PEP-CTERM system associated)